MRKSEAVGGAGPENAWAWNGASFDTMVKGYEVWTKDLGRLQNESMRFVRQRLERNVEAASAIAACRTPAEAFEMQMRFASEAISDYVDESRRMMSMLGRSASMLAPSSTEHAAK